MNKKGSAMVEATLIYPIVILCIMCVIYIIINMYMCLGYNVALSMELREQIMIQTETGYVEEESNLLKKQDLYTKKAFGKEINVCAKQEAGMQKLSGNISSQSQGNTMLDVLSIEVKKERWVIDEKEYIRKVDLLWET